MTINRDALEKIRHQLRIAEDYKHDNPGWHGADEVIRVLRKRERELANEIQVEIFRAGLREMMGMECKITG